MGRRYMIGVILIAAAFSLSWAAGVDAQVVEQENAWTIVASGDSNVTYYVGTTTEPLAVSAIGVYLGDPSFTGVEMQIRLTCFANQFNTSQAGCSVTSPLTTETVEVLNPTGQVYYFSYTTPVTLQSGKVYVMEIQRASGTENVEVYGDTAYQFSNQCTYNSSGGGTSDCTGTPYFTWNAIPDWSGLNATNTPLLALYDTDATTTLEFIQSRCVRDGLIDFGYAMCSASVYLFVPDPTIMNGYAALPDTVAAKFPFSWYVGLRDVLADLTASSTSNMATVSIGLAAIDPATTTSFGNILPNVTVLSSSTVLHFIPSATLTTLLALETAALWVLFGFFLFREIQHRWLRH